MRAFTRESFDRMKVRTAGMEFATEMVVNASHAGLRIAEIPTRLYPDKRDRPPHLRSFRDGWRHLRFMLTYAPDWLYLVPGGILSLLGVVGMTMLATGPVAIGKISLGIHFLALASLFTLLGANVIGFGILARLIGARRNPIAPDSAIGRLALMVQPGAWAGYRRLVRRRRGLSLMAGYLLNGSCAASETWRERFMWRL